MSVHEECVESSWLVGNRGLKEQTVREMWRKRICPPLSSKLGRRNTRGKRCEGSSVERTWSNFTVYLNKTQNPN
jgi:hypothetical protein